MPVSENRIRLDSVFPSLSPEKHYICEVNDKPHINMEHNILIPLLLTLGAGLATGIGSVSLVAQTAYVNAHRQRLLEDMEAAVHPDSLQILDGLSMIAVVGRGMAGRPQVASRLFDAVGRAGVNVRLIDQGTKELNIVLGVADSDYDRAMQAIFDSFFSKNTGGNSDGIPKI